MSGVESRVGSAIAERTLPPQVQPEASRLKAALGTLSDIAIAKEFQAMGETFPITPPDGGTVVFIASDVLQQQAQAIVQDAAERMESKGFPQIAEEIKMEKGADTSLPQPSLLAHVAATGDY